MRLTKFLAVPFASLILLGCGNENKEGVSDSATANKVPDVIKIGLIDPMTGAFAQQGSLTRGHIQKAIDAANQEGIIGNSKLEMVIYNIQYRPLKKNL